ncbi:MAG: glycosyltransferase family 4 protein [Anaerolineae bacterium]
MSNPLRVFYVDLCPSPGGSIFSLFHLVSQLDRSQVQPLVALATVNEFTRFEDTDIPTVRVHVPRWDRGFAAPAADSAVTAPRARAQTLRTHARGGAVWRTAGGLRRLGRDIAPVARDLVRVLRSFQPDLVHLNDIIPLNQAGALACRLTQTPAICHCRSFETASNSDIRWLLPGIDGMVFISQAIATTHLAAMPPLHHHAIIPNAVNLHDYIASDAPAELRAALGIPADAPLLTMAGRISPWKGQHVFVQALARVRAQVPAARGLIVGLAEEADGPGYAARVRAQADTLGLHDALHFTGFRRDIPAVFAASDVVVHSSVKPEPFGRVIIEGMAAGRATVATALGGTAEIITNGVDGLLVPADDSAALADALVRLLADPVERARLGAAARQTVEERYQVQTHVQAMLNFYARVLAGRH